MLFGSELHLLSLSLLIQHYLLPFSIAVDEKWIAQIWIREGEYTPDMRDALRMTQLRIHKEASEKQKKLPEKK